jgi:rare lipoprotein A
MNTLLAFGLALALFLVVVHNLFAGQDYRTQTLTASFYGDECQGRTMANGKRFNCHALTCASWDYPLGTHLRVNVGWHAVTVEVTDRGPAKALLASRQIDLSKGAWMVLGLDLRAGLSQVQVAVLPKGR